MKPKKSQPKTPTEQQARDFFQTPNYATDLIVPFLKRGLIYECAAGHRKLSRRLEHHGLSVVSTDIIDTPSVNFLSADLPAGTKTVVTNPPYSLKKEFVYRCVELCVPFALIIPTDYCGWVLDIMKNRGGRWIIPTRRINYITPTGKQRAGSSAAFHSGWFTVGIELPEQITIVELTKDMMENW